MSEIAAWVIRTLAILAYARAGWLVNKWIKEGNNWYLLEMSICLIIFIGLIFVLNNENSRL